MVQRSDAHNSIVRTKASFNAGPCEALKRSKRGYPCLRFVAPWPSFGSLALSAVHPVASYLLIRVNRVESPVLRRSRMARAERIGNT